MKRYVLMKSSRDYRFATVADAYAGESCKAAGVSKGKVYKTYRWAKAAAVKLNSVNPVGFVIVELESENSE